MSGARGGRLARRFGAVVGRAAWPVLTGNAPLLVPSALLLAGAYVAWLARFGPIAVR